MPARDICDDVAAILEPLPDPSDGIPQEQFEESLRTAQEAMQETAENLRLSWEEGDQDPVLGTLTALRSEQQRIEAHIRQLLAYGREFVHPRPYQLAALAGAANMSPSGVRTAYDDATIYHVAAATGRSLRRADYENKEEDDGRAGL